MKNARRFRRSRLATVGLLLIALVACALYSTLERSAGEGLGLSLDDGWIHLTFARSLAAGDGMSYQGDRWVSGSTAPLWTALLSLGFTLPGAPLLWSKLLGVLCYLAAVLVMVPFARVFGLRGGFPWLAGLLFAVTDWMVWSAVSGMEIPLFVLLSVIGMTLQAREAVSGWATHWALPVLALASLARPEGALLLALAVAERCVSRRARGPVTRVRVAPPREPRRFAVALGVALLVVLPFVVFSWLAGGAPVPTTFEAKLAVGHKWMPALRDLWMAAEVLFRPQAFVFLLAPVGAVAVVRRSTAARGPGLLPVLWLLALPCAYSLLAPPGRPMPVGNFGRYLFPLFPPLILLGTVGAQRLGRAFWRPWEWGAVRLPVPALTCALLLVPPARATLDGAGRHARNVANVAQSDVAAGRWIAANLPPDAVLGVQDVGAIAYLAPNPILDLVGIVTPEILAEGETGRRTMDWLRSRVVERGVDFLVVFPSSYGGEEALARSFPGLRPVRRFPVADNVTMAGPELVVYSLR